MKISGKNKSQLNLSIDIIMFLLLIPVAGIGFLMKYVLVPGIERNLIYGGNVDLEFIGLTRHQWGSIHLTLSIIFLILLLLHFILHWRVIVSVFNQMIPSISIRLGVTMFLALFSLIILFSPFFVEPEKTSSEIKHRNRINNSPSSSDINSEAEKNVVFTAQQSAETGKPIIAGEIQDSLNLINGSGHQDSEYKEYEVYGYQTLQSVSEKYNVPAGYLAHSLKIPENLTRQKLGLLKRQYSFSMSDVRKSISDYKKR
jgi:hypothetical protein